ncbi:hypothetical protein LIER_22545 [Lithospermum erythrorhizon]|uniref:Receptor-like serine/threonine-protein kinase n=1 Tax=Lithospermum erythrorhizon TaxID=34254 RepID=A0AAV3QUG1_LITER
MSNYHFFLFFLVSIFNLHFSYSQQQLHISSFNLSTSPWTPLDNQILLSEKSTFAAGFLLTSSTPKLYKFSVWYYNISTITEIWSANNQSPVDETASLEIKNGELTLLNNSSSTNLWPTKPVASTNTTQQLKLQENGNLVYGDSWQSFSFPTNTFLPGQNFSGANLTSNSGKFMFFGKKLGLAGLNDSYYESDHAFLSLDVNGKVSREDGAPFITSDYGDQKLRRLTLDEDGDLKIYSYDQKGGKWGVVWTAVVELCKIHGQCGQSSICMYDARNASTSCLCPPGFKRIPGNEDKCEIKVEMSNLKSTKFLPLDYVSFSSNQTDLKAANFTVCQSFCLNDDKCLGFMFKVDGNSFCKLILDSLLYGYWSPGTEMVTYLRVDSSETERSNFVGMTEVLETTCPVRISLPFPPEESKANTRNIIIICSLFGAELISGLFFFWTFLKKYIKYRDMARTFGLEVMPSSGPKRFTLAEIKDATDNFAKHIGTGGFGDVFMGKLSDGRVVAVKCLKNVTGGDAEFWAEVTIIARMHHLNLIRLWGFCAEKGKRILVYEYVPNGSLDKFLFQSKSSPELQRRKHDDGTEASTIKPVLDWNTRYRIALGVARAIAYLHEECLEWVLHCDIKPENILLGDDFCPKVSDFGLAKLKKKEDIATMPRVRGTRGYMAPECIGPSPITSKADVYSFGVVLLELVAGVRSSQQISSEVDSDQWFLPSWAFDKVYKEMNVDDILDERIKHSYDSRAHFAIVNRMVKTAMWCLQDRPELRPSMGKVAKMIEGTVEIIDPKKPTIFYLDKED